MYDLNSFKSHFYIIQKQKMNKTCSRQNAVFKSFVNSPLPHDKIHLLFLIFCFKNIIYAKYLIVLCSFLVISPGMNITKQTVCCFKRFPGSMQLSR